MMPIRNKYASESVELKEIKYYFGMSVTQK